MTAGFNQKWARSAIVKSCLVKNNATFEKLDELATKVSDNKSARILKLEREALFNLIFEQDEKRA